MCKSLACRYRQPTPAERADHEHLVLLGRLVVALPTWRECALRAFVV
jgi:hypothetical protein